MNTEELREYNDLKRKYDYLTEQYNVCRDMAIHMFLESVILNESANRSMTRDLTNLFNVKLSSDAFAIMLVTIERYKPGVEISMVVPWVEEVIQKHFEVFAFALCFSSGDGVGCFLSPDQLHNEDVAELEEELMEELLSYANAACDELEKMGITVSMAVSPLRSGMTPRQLYREALIIHDHCNTRGIRVASAADMPVPIPQDKTKVAINERKFMTSIVNHDFYDAASALDDIVEGLIQETQQPMEKIRSTVFQRLETVVAICGGELHPDRQNSELEAAFTAVAKAEDFDSLKEKMLDFLAVADDFCDTTQSQSKFSQVKSFVEENYTSPAMGAAMICERFKFSSSYLSKLVRRETGSGVVDLIHSIRIGKALDLLENTDMSIQDIALKVGFVNRWTFIRAFKNQEATSPSTYRARFR